MNAKKVRRDLILDQPWFGSLLLGMKEVPDDSVPRMATDGVHLYVNPEYAAKTDEPVLLASYAHEVLHCALGHFARIGNRDLETFNRAADYVVNLILRDAGFTLGDDWLVDDQYRGMAVEQVYEALRRERGASGEGTPQAGQSGGGGQSKPQPGPQSGQQSGPSGNQTQPGRQPGPSGGGDQPDKQRDMGPGSVLPCPVGDEKTLEAEWKVAMKQATEAARLQGRLPGCLAELVKQLTEPQAPWTEVLRDFLTATARDDYSWRRPNRRYAHTGFCLPAVCSWRLGTVVVALDTSGSTYGDAPRFIAELRAILNDCRPERIILVQCDAKVQDWRELQPDDEWLLNPKVKGRGGTDFRPVFQRLAEESELPDVLVFLTDLYGDFPSEPPPYPVVWATVSHKTAPFGATIQI